jgi:diaminohydroxyphosphoribosylaminopyrimidine deaminase/5-amino-6-(5-phosphoribosylamino)uracil reductase
VLTTRLPGFDHKSIRVVLDSHLKIPVDSKLAQSAGDSPLWIFHKDDPAGMKPVLEAMGLHLFQAVDLKAVLRILSERGFTRLMVEGGPTVWYNFMKAGLYDRLALYRSPRMAGAGQAAFADYNIESIGSDLGMRHTQSRLLGQDLVEIFEK